MSGRSSPRDVGGDDFTRISGIGKALDRRLHQAGVSSYADLAALDPERIASLLEDGVAVTPGRIGGEDWTGQAARLAEEAAMAQAGTAVGEGGEVATAAAAGAPASSPEASAGSPKASAAADATGPHYQSFVVRILLHEPDGRIASTTVQHVGSGAERRWPGLDKQALLDFISAYLSPGAAEPLPARRSDGPGEQRRPAVPAPSLPGEEAVLPDGEPIMRQADAGGASRVAAGDSAPRLPASSSMPGELPLTLGRDLRVPRSGEAFTISITLDLTDVELPAEPRIRFSAVVLARPVSGAAPQVVSRGEGIVSADAPLIKLHSTGLPAGTYRLEAVVELIESHGRSRNLLAHVEGGILVVSGSGAESSRGRLLQRVP